MAINKVLSRKMKSNIRKTVAALSHESKIGYAMVFTQALKRTDPATLFTAGLKPSNSVTGILRLIFQKERITVVAEPFSSASRIPGGIEYIEKAMAKYKNDLDQIIFVSVLIDTEDRVEERMRVWERPEAEYFLQLLEETIELVV